MNTLVVTLCMLVGSLCSCVKAGESCDDLGVMAYEEIGCKPVYKNNEICPVKFECQNFKPKNSSTCLFGGRSLKIGEKLDDDLTYDSCNVGCFCENRGEFECAALDCPEWLEGPRDTECYKKFEVGKCCSVGEICPSKRPSLAKCKVDDKVFLEGEEFYPKNTCMRCVCPQNGFNNGKFEAPYCKRRSCGIEVLYAKQLQQKCAPVYTRRTNSTETVLCCPEAWVCPTDDNLVYTSKTSNNSTDLTCEFGDRTINFGDGLTSKLYFYGNDINVACKCQLPPMLTCKEV